MERTYTSLTENIIQKIIIVEDDPALCELIQKILHDEGFDTIVVSSGSEAISIVKQESNVLLLLDHGLPDMTGKQVIQTLTENNIEVPFIIMTGHGDEKLAVEMMKLKARDYLVKDINFFDLLPVAINQVLEQLKTEKKLAEAEQSLYESEERFRIIYAQSPIGIIIFDFNGKFLDANKACLNIIKVSSIEEIKDINLFDYPNMPADAKERLNSGKIVRYETCFLLRNDDNNKLRRRKHQKSIYLDILITPLGWDEKELIGYLVHIQDITEQKFAEQELQNMRDELEKIVTERTSELEREIAERKEMERRLECYNAELQLFADVSAELISSTVESANKMQELAYNLLNYSKIGIDSNYFHFIDCNVILNDVLSNLNGYIEESQANITFDPLPEILADDAQLSILFQSLIENAIKFRSKETPRIHISANENETEWIFSVSDNGVGIEPEHKDEIFDLFRRLHDDTKYSGTGMGLAICKKILECHSGRIWVESQLGKGSTFYFAIPKKDF